MRVGNVYTNTTSDDWGRKVMTEFLYAGFVMTIALVVAGAAVYILGFIGSMFVGAFVSVEESIRHLGHHHGHAAA